MVIAVGVAFDLGFVSQPANLLTVVKLQQQLYYDPIIVIAVINCLNKAVTMIELTRNVNAEYWMLNLVSATKFKVAKVVKEPMLSETLSTDQPLNWQQAMLANLFKQIILTYFIDLTTS